MRKLIGIQLVALLAASAVAVTAYAQTRSGTAPTTGLPPTPASVSSAPPQAMNAPSSAPQTDLDAGGPVSCFDYYAFDSVQAHLTSDVGSTVSGTDIRFSGTLSNANRYPIVGGTLYVKVFRLRDKAPANDVNGPDVVDELAVKDDIAIPAGGSVPVSFTWKVPSYAQSGDYRLATFFKVSHKYDVLGLTFTDDVVGNAVDFKVEGEQQGGVSFAKDSVTVGGEMYRFASPVLPHVAAPSPETVAVDVANTTDTDQTASLSWQVYSWDILDQGNLLATKSVPVSIKAHGKTRVTYAVTDTANAVYVVVGTLRYHDSTSVINVRFTRDGIDKLRLNFPGLTDFPLTAGKPTTMFSCFHNTAVGVPDGTIDLALYDDHHNEIARVSYSAAISGDMHAVAKRFTPDRDYDHVTLEATLSQNGKQVDHDTIRYDCDKFNPSLCRQTSSSALDMLGGASGNIIESIAGIVLIIVLIFVGLYVRKRVRSEPMPQ